MSGHEEFNGTLRRHVCPIFPRIPAAGSTIGMRRSSDPLLPLRLAIAVGMALLILVTDLGDDAPHSAGERQAVAASSIATPDRPDGWSNLSARQQEALAPLKSLWGTMDRERQSKWRQIAGSLEEQSPNVQQRMQHRMVDWASLTSQQRALARLEYRRAATHLSPQQRRERWQAYHEVHGKQRRVAQAASSLKAIPPASAQSTQGATTVLVTQLFGSLVGEEPVQDVADGSVQSPSSPAQELAVRENGADAGIANSSPGGSSPTAAAAAAEP